MSPLEASLAQIVAELSKLGVAHALVGGLAVSARSEPRLTRDADLAVAVDDDRQAELVPAQLREQGYVLETVLEQERVGRLAAARLVDRSSGLSVDLLVASSGIEAELVDAAEALAVTTNVTAPVATTGYLIALKLLARNDRHRPNDSDDLANLRAVATDDDWRTAASAVALIVERGYHRGRNLAGDLDTLRRDGAY